MTSLLGSRFDNQIALVSQAHNVQFNALLQSAGPVLAELNAKTIWGYENSDGFWPTSADDWRTRYRPYNVINGVLQIPVLGVLLNDFGYVAYGATGYNYIARAFQRGMEDPAVRGVALMIDSPGGEVAGCWDTIDRMVAIKSKPVRAFAAESAYSAAYAVASVADTISVTRTGGVGSIGVVMSHLDISGALADRGMKLTYIFSGAHKVDGNPYEPLPEDVRARFQERCDTLYADFVSIVARNRGMTEEAVRATEALCYYGADSLSIGLADLVGAPEDALADFSAECSPEETGDDDMSTDTSAVDQAAVTQARTEGLTAGRTEERARISAILNSEAATTRPIAARELALDTDLAADVVANLLARLPAEAATSETNPFVAAMNAGPNPEVGPSAAAQESDDPVARMLAAQAAFGGGSRKA